MRQFSKEHREKLRITSTGRKHSNKKLSGKNSPRWKGGIYPENLKIRHSSEYKLWRKAVFERDDYTCRFCGQRGVEVHADHIKPFAYFPELRFSIDNGRTLCKECHRHTPTYGKKYE